MFLLAGDVFPHRANIGFTDGIMQNRFPVLGAENQVDVKAGEGLWHGLNRPFRAG